MRTFYIFNISKEFKTLTKDNPYNLFKSFEEIYNFNRNDIFIAYELFFQIAIPFDKKKLNLNICDHNRHNNNYTKFNNIHIINNYYTDEQSELVINNSFLLLKTSLIAPTFLKDIQNENLFVCDFQNKDYFWLENLV